MTFSAFFYNGTLINSLSCQLHKVLVGKLVLSHDIFTISLLGHFQQDLGIGRQSLFVKNLSIKRSTLGRHGRLGPWLVARICQKTHKLEPQLSHNWAPEIVLPWRFRQNIRSQLALIKRLKKWSCSASRLDASIFLQKRICLFKGPSLGAKIKKS